MRFIGGWRNDVFAVLNTRNWTVVFMDKDTIEKQNKKERIVGYVDGEVSYDDFKADLISHNLVDNDIEFRQYYDSIRHFGLHWKDDRLVAPSDFLESKEKRFKSLLNFMSHLSNISHSYTDLIDKILMDIEGLNYIDVSILDEDLYVLPEIHVKRLRGYVVK